MGKKFLCFLLVLVAQSYLCGAQDGVYDFGGKSAGMGNASVTISDAYSVFNNIGALAEVKKATAFAGYRNLFGLNELNILGAGFVKPFKPGVAAVSFYRFGGELFSQHKASLGFSNQFGLVSLGANVSIVQNNISTLGSGTAFVLEFGGVARLTDKIRLGAYVFNLNQGRTGENAATELPLTMKLGGAFTPTDELIVSVEVLKSLEREERVRAGINYRIIENLQVRTGIETNPVKGSFGLGFTPGRFLIDYAYSNHSTLGDIHDITFGISL